ncbi:MAG: hypothetical protein NC308_09725 [Clostridium sp.]|nr:hypothetical protein [Bacteroides sp.]MCM1199155.1 hypothetical protein [Clostridium sp.]
MNIIVDTYGGGICCRPDTTWERENKDLYSPDFIGGYMYTPVLFARIARAGKCIGEKFAERYYNSVGYGMLLYPVELLENNGGNLAWASCMDHTSILPFPMYNRITLESSENVYRINCNGEEIYSTSCGSAEMIGQAISKASCYVSMRIGDIVAIELENLRMLPSTHPGTELSATFCDNGLFGFKIIY